MARPWVVSVLVLALVCLSFPFSLHAAQIPPHIFTYQGRLTDSGGSLLGGSGTSYYFKFSVWTSPTVGSGTRVWPAAAPTSVSATVTQGVFVVNVGDTANGYPDTLNLDFSANQNIYLQVEVSSDDATFETLSPRQQITASAFAQVAGAVVGTTTPSVFGTTTPVANSFVTIAATSTDTVPLSLIGVLNQTANLFQIQNSAGSNLFSVSASGGVTATAATSTNFFATTASSTNLFTSNFSIGSLSGILKATAGAVATALVDLAADVTGILPVANGGTGLSSLTGNRILYSNSDGSALLEVATSSLNIGGNAATVTNGIYTTDTGTVTNAMLAGSIAGSKLLDAGITYAKIQNLNYGEIIGRNTAGAGVSTGLSTTTYKSMLALTSSDVGLGNLTNTAQVTSVTGTWPLISSGGATPNLTWGGLATSSPLSAASGLLYATGVNTFASVSTSSPLNTSISGNAATVTNGIYTTDTGTVTNAMLAGSIAASKLSLTKGNFIVGNDAGVAQATSTIFISSLGNVGIGTTTPYSRLSVWGAGTGATAIFELANSASTTLTSVLNDGTVYMKGSVGIGTTSPMAKLSVAAATTGHLLALSQYGTASASQKPLASFFYGNTTSENVSEFGNIRAMQPTVKGSIDDVNTLGNANDVYVSGQYAYVVTGGDVFTVIDVSDPAIPVITGTVTDGTLLDNATSVHVAGRYAYVTASNSSYLTIVDISNPNAPFIAGSLNDFPETSVPIDIEVVGRYAYMTALSTSRFTVVDVADPTAPTVVGSVTDATYLNSVQHLSISGGYAYVTSGAGDRVTVLDVSTPTAPTVVGSVTHAANLNGANQIYVSGRYAYVVTNIAHDGTDGLTIIDISNPALPVIKSALLDATYLKQPQSVQVSGRYAYLAVDNNRVTVVDIASSTAPFVVSSLLDNTNLGGGPTSISITGRYAYVTAGNRLTILNIGGIDLPNALVGNLQSTDITTWNNLDVGNNLYVRGGINAGTGGISAQGPLSISFASTTQTDAVSAYFQGRVGIGTTSPWRTLSVEGAVALNGLSTGAGAGALCLSASGEVLYNAGAACTVSSARFKHDITTSTTGLAAVLAMRPVGYFYNADIGVPGEQLGLIAEEVALIDPRLVVFDASSTPFTVKYDQLSAVFVKAIQELHLDLATIASTTASSTEASRSFAGSFFNSVFSKLTGWFADATNGITDFFANRVHTQELCLTDDAGGETCITKSNLDGLLSGDSLQTASATTAIGPLTITLNGANPTYLSVGDTYTEAGAVVSGGADGTSPYRIYVSGSIDPTTSPELDTSSPTTHILTYTTTDSAGNTVSTNRAVIVEDSADVSVPADTAPEAATTTQATTTPSADTTPLIIDTATSTATSTTP